MSHALSGSLKGAAIGALPQDTAVEYQILADNGSPTSATQGISRGMWRDFVALATEDNGGTFDFGLWYFMEGPNVWQFDGNIGYVAVAANSTESVVFDPAVGSKVYLEIKNIAAGGQASAWLLGRGTVAK